MQLSSSNNLKNLLYFESSSIKEVLKGINNTPFLTDGKCFGIVINKNNQCIGTVTDGDIRRYIIKGGSIYDKISNSMNKNFHFALSTDNNNVIVRKFEKLFHSAKTNIHTLPVLDKNKKLQSIINYKELKYYNVNKIKNIKATIPCRISFAGGGFDFTPYINKFNNSILCSTINKYITVSCLIREDSKINILNYITKKFTKYNSISSLANKKNKDDLIETTIKFANPKIGFDLEIYSDVDVGTGLGGSSATVLAVLSILNKLNNNEKNLYDLINDAYQIERIEFKNYGGWQDFYATAFGGVNWIEMYNKDILVNPLKISNEIINELQLNLMLVKIGARNKSVYSKRSYKINRLNIYSKKIYNISFKMKEALLKKEFNSFGKLMDSSWQLKKKINKRSNLIKLNKIYDGVKKFGATGGKLLGAGNSGYLLLYAPLTHQNNIKSFLKRFNLKTERVFLTNSGLNIWTL